jgi:hypothetical protein
MEKEETITLAQFDQLLTDALLKQKESIENEITYFKELCTTYEFEFQRIEALLKRGITVEHFTEMIQDVINTIKRRKETLTMLYTK